MSAVGRVALRRKEQSLPAGERQSDIERKWHVVWLRWRGDCGDLLQRGVQVDHVLIGHLRVVLVWKYRVEMPIRPLAIADGLRKLGQCPPADAVLPVRRDVGPVERAERRVQRPPAGQQRALGLDVRMAARATGHGKEISAALHGGGIGSGGLRPGRRQAECEEQRRKQTGHGAQKAASRHGHSAHIIFRRLVANQACVTPPG